MKFLLRHESHNLHLLSSRTCYISQFACMRLSLVYLGVEGVEPCLHFDLDNQAKANQLFLRLWVIFEKYKDLQRVDSLFPSFQKIHRKPELGTMFSFVMYFYSPVTVKSFIDLM